MPKTPETKYNELFGPQRTLYDQQIVKDYFRVSIQYKIMQFSAKSDF